jgi:hypothetical protein
LLHTVYKTTNLVNDKYYFGYHKTRTPQDEYLGSGKYLRNAIAKYGAANFKKDVLFVYLDAASAFGKEAELVDVFRNDPLCMNLRKGGTGGFDWINRNGLAKTPEVLAKRAASQRGQKRPKLAEQNRSRVWTEEAKRLSSERQKGRENPAAAEANRTRVWTDTSRTKLGEIQRKLKLGKKRPPHVGLAVAKANRKRSRERPIMDHGIGQSKCQRDHFLECANHCGFELHRDDADGFTANHPSPVREDVVFSNFATLWEEQKCPYCGADLLVVSK